MNKKWIPINGYKELPVGTWLVTMEEDLLDSYVHTAVVHPNICCIASNFAFDCPKVIAYRPMVEAYVPPQVGV